MVDLKRRMDGRRILVVGAGGGIGRACVQRLLAEGAVVAAADLGECWQDRPEVFEMPVDVTEQESVDRLFEQVTARLGGLDGFLYSSGVGSSRGFMDTSLAHFDRVIAVNLRGAFYCARKAAEQMGRGGSIVFVASQKGLCGSTGRLQCLKGGHGGHGAQYGAGAGACGNPGELRLPGPHGHTDVSGGYGESERSAGGPGQCGGLQSFEYDCDGGADCIGYGLCAQRGGGFHDWDGAGDRRGQHRRGQKFIKAR